MDINCTDRCIYQRDGKCNLNELKNFTDASYKKGHSDCPYCRDSILT